MSLRGPIEVGDTVIFSQLSRAYPRQNTTLKQHLRMGDPYTVSFILPMGEGQPRLLEFVETGTNVDFVEDAFTLVRKGKVHHDK